MAQAVKIEGYKKLSKELKRVSTELPKELKAIAKDAATLVADEAKTIVPVQSGKLKASIKPGVTAKGGYVKAGGGSKIVYAKVIHFGWAHHHISPQPFLYEALDGRRDEVIERFNKGVADLMNKTFTPGTGGE